jgi:FKBP-type peptidyl-prolyl cis-trans isomerase
LIKSEFKGDIFEALAMLHPGDSVTFIINGYDFLTKTAKYPRLPEGVDSTTMMYFDIKLLNAESPEAKQKAELEKAEKLKNQEPDKIKSFLARNQITVAPDDSGVYVVNQVVGPGKNIVIGDFVKLHLTVSNIEGKKIFSTLDKGNPITFEYGKPFDTRGLDKSLKSLKKGGKAKIIVPSSMAFAERGRRDMSGAFIIEPYSPVVYDVEIVDLQTKAEHEKTVKLEEQKAKQVADEAKAKEPIEIQKYLKANNINVAPTASGIYYVERVKGKGPKAAKGQKVAVQYTGKLMNGKVFDSSLNHKPAKPYDVTIGAGQVIPGWEEVLPMMSVGTKATVVIPSKLAYGEHGAGQDIPAFSPLVFELEMVTISK